MRAPPPLMALLALVACTDQAKTDTGDSAGDTDTASEETDTETLDPCPRVTPESLLVEIGPAAAGGSVTGEIALTNSCDGEVPLVVTASLDSSSSTTFSISSDNLVIPPGITMGVEVTFSPPDFAQYSATALLETNDPFNPSLSIVLSGQAAADADGDGYDSLAAGGADCDDTDASIYPGADELWYDSVDGDCAGDDDFDADADGYQTDAYGGEDCDDTDADTFPGAEDTWYDGTDSDCAGNSDYDVDGDGQDNDDYRGGEDCDDTDPAIYSGASDTPYDGTDSDCDGTSDYDADKDGADSPDYGGDDCDDDDASVYPDATDDFDDVDSDCDGLLDEDGVVEGDVLVTEIMMNPLESNDPYGEWFEIYNGASHSIDLYGWSLDHSGAESTLIDEHLTIKAGKYKIFASSSDESKNGGITPDFVYDRAYFTLSNVNDTVGISVESRSISSVHYKADWPLSEGYSLSLDPGHYTLADMGLSTSWCVATTTFGDGDYGTPGSVNDC